MTVSDVTSRIAMIQSQLALLTPPRATSTAFTGALATAATGTAGTAGTSTVGGTTAVSGVSGEAVVAEARKYLGVPYLWGGTDPQKGLDCSGLIQLVYKNLGVEIPRVSYQQATAGRPVASLAEAQPGDILAFNSPVNHVGIYIGNNQMIEAPRTGLDVRVIDVYETPTAIRRILPDGATGAVGRAGPGTGGAVAGVPFSELFNGAAQKYGVDASLLAAVARQESGYDPTAVSPAGAQGLMQLMPGTAQGLGVTNSFDPTQAVDGAARLLRDLLDRFGTTPLALAAYNAGPGAVLRYDGIPPYPETQSYVRSVMSMLGASR
ncbi:MAG: transglycosylase SLT domain-containing protein [Nocardioides sp.]|nr:transglycosylase SLT domain-containing protein [Nocardioides sp.]